MEMEPRPSIKTSTRTIPTRSPDNTILTARLSGIRSRDRQFMVLLSITTAAQLRTSTIAQAASSRPTQTSSSPTAAALSISRITWIIGHASLPSRSSSRMRAQSLLTSHGSKSDKPPTRRTKKTLARNVSVTRAWLTSLPGRSIARCASTSMPR